MSTELECSKSPYPRLDVSGVSGCSALRLKRLFSTASQRLFSTSICAAARGNQENGQRQTHCLEPWASTVLHFLLLLLLLAPVFYFVFVTFVLLCLALLCATFWIDHAAWRTASLAFLRASALVTELFHELRKSSKLRPLKGATRKNIVSS